MDPWYKVATPRKEVREGRSFNPDEFAIALEQVVAGTAPEDYRDPAQFFARTCFTRALREHASMVLRRLSGRTDNTSPVLTLITQFGGGKTHTLTTLYHLARNGDAVADHNGVADLVRDAGVRAVPKAKVAVFVGNAWDPQPGRETPWVDIAHQLAGDKGVEALGAVAKTTPPGTDAIARVFQAAGAPVLLLFDEVLNYLNRHRDGAESFHAFIQNLTVATTGTTHGAAVISLPRSQVEMTASDQEWQDKISKVVRRVAKDLIANDETEISEVVRRRLFQDLGSDKIRKNVCTAFGDWCFERRAQLPPEWTAVDSAATETKSPVVADGQDTDGLKVIDLGAGHSSSGETLCGRVIGALKSEALLNESVGAGYIERNWPPAFQSIGAWPLTSLRQSFLDGSLTRLIDPDAILRKQITTFVENGDFGLASGAKNDDTYSRLWYDEPIRQEEVAFESGVLLLTKAKAEELKTVLAGSAHPQPGPSRDPSPEPEPEPDPEPTPGTEKTILRLAGTVPPELWNRLGTRVLPKLRSGDDLSAGIEFSVSVNSQVARNMETELLQILDELGLSNTIRVQRS